MWRKTAVFILLLIVLAGISSCINDDDIDGEEVTPDVLLTGADLAWVPYNEGDEFVMWHSGGQQLTFRVESIEPGYHMFDPDWWEWGGSGEETVSFEDRSYFIQSDFLPIKIQLSLLKSYRLDSTRLAIADTVTLLAANTAYVSFSLLQDSGEIDDNALFHDRLFIGNQWHEDVIYAFDSSGVEILNGAIKPIGLWYNTNTGLLKLSYNNGDSIVVE